MKAETALQVIKPLGLSDAELLRLADLLLGNVPEDVPKVNKRLRVDRAALDFKKRLQK